MVLEQGWTLINFTRIKKVVSPCNPPSFKRMLKSDHKAGIGFPG
jgi:hypothetical protein